MGELVLSAINAVNEGLNAYCKFLSANDSGETGGHQKGILVSRTASRMMFTEEEILGNHILKKTRKVKWQDDFETDCTFTWYESKKELRLTGFGRGFDLLRPEYTGALFVFTELNDEKYLGYMLNTDEDIQSFLDAFGLTPAETNRLIEFERVTTEDREKIAIESYIQGLNVDFPASTEMSKAARMIYYTAVLDKARSVSDPDTTLLRWTEEEYRLFKAIEQERYGRIVADGFDTVDEFVSMANQVLNRRKSRAGKSFEHHLAAIFDDNKIKYTAQAVTEGNKRPDFLFPSEEAYHDLTFSVEELCTLAAKTTCKDRWRQILNEADRLRDENKYLCTMQQGISRAQMDEMQEEKVILVVPKPYISSYPSDRRDRIWTIADFVDYIKRMEKIS
jgi:hypothetical protein